MNYELRIRNLITTLLILSLILAPFTFIQAQVTPPETFKDYNPPTTLPSSMGPGPSAKEMEKKVTIAPPETLEEAKEIGERAVTVSQKELPGILEKIWKEEVLPVWQKMWEWFKLNIWSKVESWFKKVISPEIEKRKPIIKEEFQKEKEEVKEEVPKIGQSLWERFKELIK